jgi:hypothetical protein
MESTHMTGMARRVSAVFAGMIAVAAVGGDEPSFEQYRQMGATAAFWVVARPLIGLVMLVGAILLWRAPKAKGGGQVAER